MYISAVFNPLFHSTISYIKRKRKELDYIFLYQTCGHSLYTTRAVSQYEFHHNVMVKYFGGCFLFLLIFSSSQDTTLIDELQ